MKNQNHESNIKKLQQKFISIPAIENKKKLALGFIAIEKQISIDKAKYLEHTHRSSQSGRIVFSNRDLSNEIIKPVKAKKIKMPLQKEDTNTHRLIEDLDLISKGLSDGGASDLGKTWTLNTNKLSPKTEIRIKEIPEVTKALNKKPAIINNKSRSRFFAIRK
jgi:hypothetical protein